MQKFVSAGRILDRVNRDLGFQIDDATVLEWMGDVIDDIGVPMMYDESVALLEVSEHKAPMPDGCVSLIQIAKYDMPYESPKECVEKIEEEVKEVDEDVTCCSGNPWPGTERSGPTFLGPWLDLQFNYDIFCGLRQRTSAWKPVRLATHSFFDTVVCTLPEQIYDDVNDEYTIKGNSLQFSFKEGLVLLAYLKWRLDEDGFPMIPDDSSFINAVLAYIRYMYWQRKVDQEANRNNLNRLEMADRDYQWKVQQAANTAMKPDLAQMENIAARKDYLLPQQFRWSSFFGPLNNREKRRWNNPIRNRWR